MKPIYLHDRTIITPIGTLAYPETFDGRTELYKTVRLEEFQERIGKYIVAGVATLCHADIHPYTGRQKQRNQPYTHNVEHSLVFIGRFIALYDGIEFQGHIKQKTKNQETQLSELVFENDLTEHRVQAILAGYEKQFEKIKELN